MTIEMARSRTALAEVESAILTDPPATAVSTDHLGPEQLSAVDPSGLWRRLADLPDQAARAWRIGTTSAIPRPEAIERIVVMGMGGSAIGAQLVSRILQQRSSVPLEVVRDSHLPVMDERTLLVFCSFSGDTEEVLAAVRASIGRPGATIAITRGGALAREAAAHDFPTILYEYDGEPRSALGYGTMLLLGVLHRFGVFTTTDDEIEQTLAEIRRCSEAHGPGVPLADNPARSLARQVGTAVPVILADASLVGAAVRWQNQCNENGKRWAFSGMLPEAMHNIVEGIQRDEAPAAAFHVVLLEDRSRPQVARLRLDAFEQHLSEAGLAWTRLTFDGSGDLSILLQACIVGDWVSYYLALDAGVDPSPVPAISRLKARVADKIVRSTVGAR